MMNTGAVAGGAQASAQQPAEAAQASAANTVFAIDTQHEDNINDCQFDHYGTQVASCDSNGFL